MRRNLRPSVSQHTIRPKRKDQQPALVTVDKLVQITFIHNQLPTRLFAATMSSNTSTSDMEKLMEALSSITSIRNFDDILALFGIVDLPTAQKYGIIFGCLVFTITISTVLTLLVLGGSFKRIEEQEKMGAHRAAMPGSVEERVSRPLLLERLLEAQARLMEKYTTQEQANKTNNSDEPTPLASMLMNVAPNVEKAKEYMSTMVDEKDEKVLQKRKDEAKKFLPEGYEENYVKAYRKCQDKPGGAAISGEPEARFEAYARAYAGCGVYANASYRRSYARIYESVACIGHGNEAKYRKDWLERPQDIVGRTVRLENMEVNRHMSKFHAMTCGDVYKENKPFDPNEVWAFWPEGPFEHAKDMKSSFLFHRKPNEAGFAIIEAMTDEMIGFVFLTNDNPQNLSISLELPIVKPSSEGTVESIEACYLLVDRLFALGYRRIQLSIDSMDTNGKKLAGRLGFTQEGLLPKDRIIKESNRDSIIYGMLNSDWTKGARAFLYKKLHGEKAMKTDAAFNKKEEELDEQEKGLAAKKAKEEEETLTKENK